ncbi:AraC family transcriptional regulator [Paenibacillus sp. 1P07SE]|uniref:helix-turn-helix transcriptional regulator n=1 Tax=Paenibacillus sp. 1P07SE TaxID=3132209 RepID=UPI0039A4AF5B
MPIKRRITPPFTIHTSTSYNNRTQYHTHFHYEIYYFRGGKVNYLINDRIHILEPGDMLLMHGMTLHKAHVINNDAYVRTTLHFDPYFFKQYIQPAYAPDLLMPFEKLHNVRLQLRNEDKAEVEAALQKLEELYRQHTPHAHQRFQARLLDLLILIYDLCKQPLHTLSSLPTSKEQHVQEIITYVEAVFRNEMTLEALQNELHLSKYYLAKTFKEVTGMTIFQHLMHRRIYQAKLELIECGKSITAVGYEVGFKHPSHFSRVFKEHTSMTPERYRKEHKLHAGNKPKAVP